MVIYIKDRRQWGKLAARGMEPFFFFFFSFFGTQTYSTLLSTHMYTLEGNGQELTGQGGI